jgi:hypothetical protein
MATAPPSSHGTVSTTNPSEGSPRSVHSTHRLGEGSARPWPSRGCLRLEGAWDLCSERAALICIGGERLQKERMALVEAGSTPRSLTRSASNSRQESNGSKHDMCASRNKACKAIGGSSAEDELRGADHTRRVRPARVVALENQYVCACFRQSDGARSFARHQLRSTFAVADRIGAPNIPLTGVWAVELARLKRRIRPGCDERSTPVSAFRTGGCTLHLRRETMYTKYATPVPNLPAHGFTSSGLASAGRWMMYAPYCARVYRPCWHRPLCITVLCNLPFSRFFF